jgi:hypothetical protein
MSRRVHAFSRSQAPALPEILKRPSVARPFSRHCSNKCREHKDGFCHFSKPIGCRPARVSSEPSDYSDSGDIRSMAGGGGRAGKRHARLWCLLGQRAPLDVLRPRLNRIRRSIAHRGVFAVVAIRLVPVAPFTLVNSGFQPVSVVNGVRRVRNSMRCPPDA